jgi:protein-S-isoprenylcysteine O-methyltransferase Ste14
VTAPRPPLLRDAYELLLALVLGWLLLFPVHRSTLEHRNLTHTIDADTALVRGEGLTVGQELPAYRFHGGWQVPIGTLRVEHRIGQDAVLRPAGPMRWPIGRHGRIVTEEAGVVVVDVGSELGLEVGRNLGVYADRRWLGDVTLTEVGAGRSTARIRFAPDRPLAGLPVTEFTVMTQVVVRRETPLTLAAQVALGFGPAVAWALVRLRTGASPFAALGTALRARAPGWVAAARWLEVPAAGLLVGAFAPSALALLVSKGSSALHRAWPVVPAVDPWPLFEPWTEVALAAATGAAGAWALATGRSPLVAIRSALAWERSPVARVPERWRPAVNWALHLFVVWAFASTLGGFLVANLAAAREQLAQGPPSLEGAFEVAKLALWSITIVGCILGYAHTVLGPLFGKQVHHLDFTLAGWVTNAACYPLLGLAMARLVGPRSGLDPVVCGGFGGGLLLVLGMLTNVAYTASIWNMGPRFGVMTDKGLVSSGFFGVVRHPSYTLEALMFLLVEAPGYTSWREWLAGLSVAWLYWLRSEREDAFMGASNPDYAPYRHRVPDRYVPGLW